MGTIAPQGANGHLLTRADPGVDAVTLGFQPKALIFVLSNRTTFDSVAGAVTLCVGVTDGTTTRSAGARDTTAVGTTQTARAWTSDISLVDDTGGFNSAVGAITLTTSGFEINWSTKVAHHALAYLAIGGANVSAKVLGYSKGVGAGAVAVTGAGFQPKGGVFLSGFLNTLAGSAQDGLMSVGFGDDDTNAATIGWASDDGVAAADTSHVCNSTRLINVRFPDNSGTLVQCDLTSWDVDGYTITYNTNNLGAHLGAALVLGGAGINAVDIVDLTADTTTGAHTQTMSGLPFQPDAAVVMGVSGTSGVVSGVTARASVGFFDGSLRQGSVLAQAVDAADPTDTEAAPLTGALGAYNSTDGNLDAFGKISAIGATSIDVGWQPGKTADAFVWKALLIDLA